MSHISFLKMTYKIEFCQTNVLSAQYFMKQTCSSFSCYGTKVLHVNSMFSN